MNPEVKAKWLEAFPSNYKPARLIPVKEIEPFPRVIQDIATSERRVFIENVSPFLRPCERRRYLIAFFVSLVIGRGMPHETRYDYVH